MQSHLKPNNAPQQQIHKKQQFLNLKFLHKLLLKAQSYIRLHHQFANSSTINLREIKDNLIELKEVCDLAVKLRRAINEKQRKQVLEEILNLIRQFSILKDSELKVQDYDGRVNSNNFIKQNLCCIIERLISIAVSIFPQKITQSVLFDYCEVILIIFLGIKPHSGDLDHLKKKGGHVEKYKKNNIFFFIFTNGTKIELQWYLVMRLIQKPIESESSNDLDFENQDENSNSQINKNSKTQKNEANYIIQKNVQPMISKFINNFLEMYIDEAKLIKSFVRTVVDCIGQMELPIVPSFLVELFNKQKDQFKFYQKQLASKTSKESQFFENLEIYLDLVNIINKILKYEAEYSNQDSVCSYCGLEIKLSLGKDPLSLHLKLLSNQSITILKVCNSCLQHLNVAKDNDQFNMSALFPLILSHFNKTFSESTNSKGVKQAINRLLVYHQLYSKQDSNEKKNNFNKKIYIQQKIAMNSLEQNTEKSLIQSAYRLFIFQHNKLSIQKILNHCFHMIIALIDDSNEYLRKMALKICNKKLIGNLKIENYFQMKEMKKWYKQLVKAASFRITDSNMQVRLQALQFISKCHSSEFDSQRFRLFKKISEQLKYTNDAEFQLKSLNFLEKDFIKPCQTILTTKKLNKMSKQALICTLDVFFQSFKFLLQFHLKNSQLICQERKLFQSRVDNLFRQSLKTLQKLSDKNLESYTEKLTLERFSLLILDKQEIQQTIQMYDLTLEKLYEGFRLSVDFLCSFAKIPHKLVIESIKKMALFQIQEDYKKLENIFANTISLVEAIFQQPIHISQCIVKQDYKSIKNNKKGEYSTHLVQLLFSNDFLKMLVEQAAVSLTSKRILSYLLSNYITLRAIRVSSMISVYLGSTKNYRFIKDDSLTIYLNKSLEERFEKLIEDEEKMIITSYSENTEKICELIVTFFVFVNRRDKVEEKIYNYNRYATGLMMVKGNSSNNQKVFLRCLQIMAFMAVYLQKYQKVVSRIRRFEAQIDPNNSQQETNDSQQSKPYSHIYQNCYRLCERAFEEQETITSQMETKQKVYNLIRIFWKGNPSIILLSGSVIRNLEQKFKDKDIAIFLYSSLLSLLPSSKTLVLSTIQNIFKNTFPSLLKSQQLCKNQQLMILGFELQFHLIKSGIIGIYQSCKYLFYGVFGDCEELAEVAFKTIIMIKQTDSVIKILMSLGESLSFVFENIPKETNFIFNWIMVSHIKQFCEFFKGEKKNIYLPKDKKEIKRRSTFLKKIGQLLDSDTEIFQKKPQFLFFILKVVRCQSHMDYTELIEIIHSLSLIADRNYFFVEKIRSSLVDEDSIIVKDKFLEIDFSNLKKVQIYQELLSCLCYLTEYKGIKAQIKSYTKQFQMNPNVYIQLEDKNNDILSPMNEAETNFQNKIRNIEIFYGLLQGLYTYENQQFDQSKKNYKQTKKPKKPRRKRDQFEIIETKSKSFCSYNKSVDRFKDQNSNNENTQNYRDKLRRRDRTNLSFCF